MDPPIKSPSETEAILEDVARFRALSPRGRFQFIRDLLAEGDRLRRNSPDAAEADRYAKGQEPLAKTNIQEFLARHGY